jgi:hypothetical protein
MGIILFLFSGCQSQEQGRPKILRQENSKLVYAQRVLDRSTQPKIDELKLKKMELQTQKEIETLHAKKELELIEGELKSALIAAKSKKLGQKQEIPSKKS